jgi:pyruvate/2-oxoglutarate dehydrogenase complex dihydrolipoamide dehydrogenase (E3) component
MINITPILFFNSFLQISSVGMAKEDAANIFGADCIAVIKQNILDTDRGVCEGNEEGFIQVIYRKKNYEILGATIVSPVAGELIAEIGVAMKSGLTFDMMATVMHTYPSHSFALQAMAAEVYYDKLVKSKRILNLLKKIGL